MKPDRIFSMILTTEQGYRLGLATAVLFTALLVLSAFGMLGSWWSDARLSSVSKAEKAAIRDLSSPLSELAKAVPQAHLFGYHAPASAYVPITNLQLRLTGIIQVGGDDVFSKAIISAQGGTGKIYQLGDSVLDGIRLTAIHADGVVLDNNGHSESLPMQRPNLGRK